MEALEPPADARILGPQIVREICYRVMCGEAGGPLRSLAAPHGRFGQIHRALRLIHQDFASPLDIATLAAAAGAARLVGYESASPFSREFKRFFGSPPAAEAGKLKAA